MLEIKNRTPFAVGLFPGLARDGYDEATVLVKGTFDLARGAPRVADEQVEIHHGDQFHGDPSSSSIRYECDTSPAKRGTDVVLVGHAHPRRAATAIDVGLAVGKLRKVVRVFGDRTWRRGLGGFEPSSPAPFERMPLVYERAFGGTDTKDADPVKHGSERRNPVGKGFTMDAKAARVSGLPLPNLEDPRAPIATPEDRPAPACFGFIGRSWMPRVSFAGTYDERWRAERCPLLPSDFDERYHNGASPDLIASPHLVGGEPVVVTNASEHGELRFDVPTPALSVAVKVRGQVEARRPLLDTIVIEPDLARVVLSFRTTFRCPRTFLFIDDIVVTEGGGT